MRKLIKATVLTLAFAMPAWAGDIGAPIAPSGEMGSPIASCTESAKTGEMGTPIAASDIAVSLLQSLLALF